MIYAIVLLNIKDKDALARYRAQAGAALARHGGAVVNAGPAPERLEGEGPVPDMMALLSFPSVDAARAWRSDPDLAQVHALRESIGSSTIYIVPGG